MKLLALIGLLTLAAPAADQEGSFGRAVDAYRRGDYEAAESYWRATLEEPLTTPLTTKERARVLYDLGNAAWRRGEALEAVGWYTACIRIDPRNRDAWYNLNRARSESGLEPADRGDLPATLRRLVRSLTAAESAWLVLAAALLLALPLVGEALRGGRAWKGLSLAAALLLLVSLVPWSRRLFDDPGDPYLVIAQPAIVLRAEPREDLPAIGALDAGEEVQRIDELADWLRIERADGEQGWVPRDTLLALIP